MANVFDNAVKGYTIGLNNKINAQKAYINSYLDGINARNAVNQEARTQDQYFNYIQPFQASNLGLTLAEQSLKTEMANDPTNRQYQRTITASDLGYRAGMGEQNLLNLPTDRNTSSNVASTNNTNSAFNKNASAFSLSAQGDLQKIEKDRIAHLINAIPLKNKAELLALGSQVSSLENPQTTTQIVGENPNGTPTTIMLQNGSTPSTNKYWTDRFLNPTVTTPASGLPSNPSNTQQTGQQQVPTGYTNKYYENIDGVRAKLQSEIEKQTQLSDLARQYGKPLDYVDAQFNLNVAKKALSDLTGNSIYNRANRFALSPFNALFNNQSKKDYDYEQATRNFNNR